jgi:serine phosphatase RsbU (regulator of sigma subunit)
VEDQQNPAGDYYGRRQVARLLKEIWREPAKGIRNAILKDLERFSEGAGRDDDQTLMVLKVK